MGEFVDCIGMESRVDLKPDVETPKLHGGGVCLRRRSEAAEKGYPPPMQHEAWVMRKYYTNDGRLIIKEEKPERGEYFQAHRCNGRLVLNMVPVDVDVSDQPPPCAVERCEEEEVGGGESSGDGIDDGVEGLEEGDDQTVEEASSECYKGNTCGGFRVAVPAFKAVIT
ncbi:protein FANTASTIC FOUR 1 [Dorcoceras hygrometricum]|uniref:Protein FANTASTIC FOUR 1 n=1 Tax=Dorcoceras hygrometricum TaxID=472368 RepID=A0A2Z7B3H2_9LAMI|nr:protein FANTASTIC FOUR 1 [Dorcoceras hygrometricum]